MLTAKMMMPSLFNKLKSLLKEQLLLLICLIQYILLKY